MVGCSTRRVVVVVEYSWYVRKYGHWKTKSNCDPSISRLVVAVVNRIQSSSPNKTPILQQASKQHVDVVFFSFFGSMERPLRWLRPTSAWMTKSINEPWKSKECLHGNAFPEYIHTYIQYLLPWEYSRCWEWDTHRHTGSFATNQTGSRNNESAGCKSDKDTSDQRIVSPTQTSVTRQLDLRKSHIWLRICEKVFLSSSKDLRPDKDNCPLHARRNMRSPQKWAVLALAPSKVRGKSVRIAENTFRDCMWILHERTNQRINECLPICVGCWKIQVQRTRIRVKQWHQRMVSTECQKILWIFFLWRAYFHCLLRPRAFIVFGESSLWGTHAVSTSPLVVVIARPCWNY